MKKHLCRILCGMIILVLAVSILPLNAFANGPAPMPELYFKLSNLPEGTAYVDLAVCAPESELTDLAQEPPEGVPHDSPLVRGEYEGYVSYSFRVRHASSAIVQDRQGCVHFSHSEEIPQWGKVRLVMADSQGEILKISQPFDILPKGLFESSLNWFEYDAQNDCLQMDTHVYSVAWFIYIVVSLVGILLTCGVEWGVAAAFRLTAAYSKIILLTNVCSQVVMRILFVILYNLLPRYILVMALLETLVYSGEFVVYQMTLFGFSTKKRLLYVLTANTASLVAGLLLNLYFH